MEYLNELVKKLNSLPDLLSSFLPLPIQIIIGAVILALITLAVKRIFF